jgi:serine/threonine-protein kinase
MATVHLARIGAAAGFSRTVAIKRLHPHYAQDPDFVAMFVDEARIVSRIRHTNVVQTLEIESEGGELFLVMEYIHGEALAKLLREIERDGECVPLPIAIALTLNMLHGLHAAHEATDEDGHPLGVVHRDVTPQNLLVGADGIGRMIDFGVAKAASRVRVTSDGKTRGKMGYMAPEHVKGDDVDRRADVFAAAVCCWELLCGKRLFDGDNDAALIFQIMNDPIPRPEGVPTDVAKVVMKGLEKDPDKRYQSALEMAKALENAAAPASAATVAEWVMATAGEGLQKRAARVKAVEAAHAKAHVADPTSQRHIPVVTPSSPSLPPLSDRASMSDRSSITTGSFEATIGVRPAPKWIYGLAGLGAAAIVLLLTFVVFGHKEPPPDTKLASSAPPPPSVSVEKIVEIVEVPVPVPTTSQMELPSNAPAVKPPPSPGPAPAPAPRPGPAPNPKGKCNPPYTTDAHGIHHPKPECL